MTEEDDSQETWLITRTKSYTDLADFLWRWTPGNYRVFNLEFMWISPNKHYIKGSRSECEKFLHKSDWVKHAEKVSHEPGI